MTVQLVHASGNMFAPEEIRHGIVHQALEEGDLVTLSEIVEDHLFLATIRGPWGLVARSELAILWRDDRYRRLEHGHRMVMRGGRRGRYRSTGDARRRGPNRLVLWALLEDLETGEQLLVATHHAIAKADTTHQWRRRLRRRGFLRTAWTIRAVRRQHPGVPAVLTGDLNSIGRITAFAIAGLRRVPTPPTFGPKEYDRFYVTAGLAVTRQRTFRTRGDHLGLAATLRHTLEIS